MPSHLPYSHFFSEHQIAFAYQGPLTGDIVASILQAADARLNLSSLPRRKKKATINILIEGLQNMLYHGEHTGGMAVFVALQISSEGVAILTGNAISASDAQRLKDRIKFLNSLTAEEVHAEYINRLEKGTLSEKGGAGLGILRIRKDSGMPLLARYDDLEDGRVYFSLTITVPFINEAVQVQI